MKHRTNLERLARKERKAIELIDKKKKATHISFHQKADYHSIIASVKSKSTHYVLRNAHARKDIDKLILVPKIFHTGGTYTRPVTTGRQRRV